VLFAHSMLSARCFSLKRLVAVTLPQVGINDKKKTKILLSSGGGQNLKMTFMRDSISKYLQCELSRLLVELMLGRIF
jgi:hypothetical protein